MSTTIETISSVSNEAPRAKVMRELRRWIQQGKLVPGEPLPSERVFSQHFKVDRSVIRWVLHSLEEEGVVRHNGGKTRIACEIPKTAESNGLMRNAVVILAQSRGVRPSHHVSGWMDYLSLGAFEAIDNRNLHAVAFNPGRLAEEIEHLVQERPVGLIVPEVAGQSLPAKEILDRMLAARIPVVVYGDEAEAAGCDRVVVDHEQGSYELTRCLIARGCKRIQMIWACYTGQYWTLAREAGYTRAMLEAELSPLPVVGMVPTVMASCGSNDAELLRARARYLAGYLLEHVQGANKVDAIMAPTDGDAFSVAMALRMLGKVPNRDVMVAGYDNFWADCDLERQHEAATPVATVDKCNLDAGRMMVELLMERVSGSLPDEPQRRLVTPKLIQIA